MAQKILITCGLPYANGNAHLGHLVEYLQGDIYSRALKLAGEDAIFLCASDTHGAPIEVKAREAGKPPEEFVAHFSAAQQRDFKDFGITFDYFYTTHSEENRRHAEFIFQKLSEKGQISTRPVEQYYCEVDRRFLPDRFIKGSCPNCKSPDQYGDVCEVCGKTYNPTDLGEPYCALCKTPPVRRSSKHYFFNLAAYAAPLAEWLNTADRVQPEVRNFVAKWIEEGLRDWDISRDGPYFGFKIPGEEDKYFYVWLDAPVGYIATTEKFCKETGRDFDAYWRSGAAAEPARIEHIIGKDIVYFHTLFWPAMLMGAGYTLPARVLVHGMLTVNGAKMSKTRGTFINARTYLDHLDPQYLRYYFAAHMTPRVEDIDLNLKDFADRVNGELVNNVVNLASRSIQQANQLFGGKLGRLPADCLELVAKINGIAPQVISAYRERDFAAAIRRVLEISSIANLYYQEKAPWAAAKTDPARAAGIITFAINVVKLCAQLLKPVLPKYAADIEEILRIAPLTFEKATASGLEDTSIGPFKRLMDRVDAKAIDRVVAASVIPDEKAAAKAPEKAKKEAKAAAPPAAPEAPPAEISIDDFAKVDLRVGLVVAAEAVPKADKLLKLSIDLGEGAPRTVVSGIAKAYKPEELVGRRVAVVANLAKKALRGIESHGMVLAGGEPPALVSVPEHLAPGEKIK